MKKLVLFILSLLFLASCDNTELKPYGVVKSIKESPREGRYIIEVEFGDIGDSYIHNENFDIYKPFNIGEYVVLDTIGIPIGFVDEIEESKKHWSKIKKRTKVYYRSSGTSQTYEWFTFDYELKLGQDIYIRKFKTEKENKKENNSKFIE
jgi:hypothetical protein